MKSDASLSDLVLTNVEALAINENDEKWLDTNVRIQMME
jgi:hypothetical protein